MNLCPPMTPGVTAARRNAVIVLFQEFAALCRDAATVRGYKARSLRGILVLLLLPFLSLGAATFAEPPKPNPNADADGQTLVAQLLAQRPPLGATTNHCLLSVRPARGQGARHTIPVRLSEVVTADGWTSIYESAPTNQSARARLVIHRRANQANEYSLAEAATGGNLEAAQRTLTGGETMVPFAGSDFWVAELGLEFLHWPVQRLLKKEMTRGQSCNVLESVAPATQTNGYVRVKAWLDIDTGGVVYAEAYDAQAKLVKEFAPKGLKKVAGGWELEEVEIINRRTGSRTRMQFEFPENPTSAAPSDKLVPKSGVAQ